MKKFIPSSPDKFLKNDEDMSLAKFGHINALAEAVTKTETDIATNTAAIAAIPAPTPAPLYLEVDITSAQILAIGTSPIEPLPAAGANQYYDVDKLILEHTLSIDENLYSNSELSIISNGSVIAQTNVSFLGADENTVAIVPVTLLQNNATDGIVEVGGLGIINRNLRLGTPDDTNPTGGDGTLKVKIWYTVRTFG